MNYIVPADRLEVQVCKQPDTARPAATLGGVRQFFEAAGCIACRRMIQRVFL